VIALAHAAAGDAAQDGYTLERFAQHSFYQDVNRRLVQLSEVSRGQRVVDLGAGTGAVTRLLAEALGPGACVTAIEPALDQIESGRHELRHLGNGVSWVQGGVEVLGRLSRKPDSLFFCNAIHLVPEKEQLLREIARWMAPGGTLSLNTSFFDGAEPAEAAQFYRRWMIKSLRVLKTRYGLSPTHAKAEARRRLTAEEYVQLLGLCGYEVLTHEVMTVPMTLGGFEDISRYSLWIEGVLPGVPLDAGSASLVEGARQAFEDLQLTTSPRSWLLIVARQPHHAAAHEQKPTLQLIA
jgi:ubiquinone/menaquinone biosynthesis C-methylase UbiE